jgi:MoxR-like ATPase
MDSNESNERTDNGRPSVEELAELRRDAERIAEQIHKTIIGQDELIRLLIVGLFARGHILIEGVPGVAKTLSAKLLAATTSIAFSRIQFTPDLMPSDILGTSIYNVKLSEFEFKPGPIFANVILVDEINRSPAKTQAALFEVMEERQVTIDGRSYPMDPPFIVLATENPIEHEGTYRLPEAQLDRFLFKIVVGYPSLEEEITLIHRFDATQDALAALLPDAVVSSSDIARYQDVVARVFVDGPLIDYIARIVVATRDNRSLYVGASPRASLAILNGSKATAAMSGRDFVTPEDIRGVTFPVLRHRIILTPEQEMEGRRTDDVIREIVESIPVPR